MAAGTPLSPSLLFSKMGVKGYLSHGVTEARQWDEVVKGSLSTLENYQVFGKIWFIGMIYSV